MHLVKINQFVGIWLYLSMYAICKYTCGIAEMVQLVMVPATWQPE